MPPHTEQSRSRRNALEGQIPECYDGDLCPGSSAGEARGRAPEHSFCYRPSGMLELIILGIALVSPIILRRNGKRWLGDQTHPAAVFILCWMACAFALSSVEFITAPIGALALIWVILVYAGFAVVEKVRRKPAQSVEETAGAKPEADK